MRRDEPTWLRRSTADRASRHGVSALGGDESVQKPPEDVEMIFEPPPSAIAYYGATLSRQMMLFWIINCTFAGLFTAIQPGPNWTYLNSLYHCVVTATTVGYGDVDLISQAGRVLAIFHILVSTSWIASTLGHLTVKYQQRKAQLWHAEHLRMQLDPDLLR